jgi:exopolysaccharide biosynthesis polyprenyl glycosylphosphotransferase
LNFSYISNASVDSFQPTIEVNQRLRARKKIVITGSIVFMAIEYLLMLLLFFSLYIMRVSYEFDRPFSFFSIMNPRFDEYFVFFISFSLIYGIFVYRYKLYLFRPKSGYIDELSSAIKAITYTVISAVGVIYLLNFDEVSRLVVLVFWAISLFGAGILRAIKRAVYFSLSKRGFMSKNVIIIGAGKVGHSLIEELTKHKWLGYHVVGYLDDTASSRIHGVNSLGSLSRLKETVTKLDIDEVIITIPSERDLVQSIITDLRKLDVSIKIIPDMFNLVTSTVEIGSINALPVVSLVKTPMRGLAFLFKRSVDIIGAFILLLICAPLFALTALAIKLDSEGPVFYRQQRIGKNGRAFHMFKFRSMQANADAMLESLEAQNEVHGLAFKIKNDPRVTRIGRFLRKYSIDELPQLINVLKGDMSLVGPRPPLPYEVEKYGDWEWRRLDVLPGITGLWQVSGRSDLSFQQWVKLDIYYIENWSIGLDFKILLKTIPCVIKGEGAY